MAKHIAKPLEFSFATDIFRLEVEQTQDGARLQRELDESRNARMFQQRLQRTLHLDTLKEDEKETGPR